MPNPWTSIPVLSSPFHHLVDGDILHSRHEVEQGFSHTYPFVVVNGWDIGVRIRIGKQGQSSLGRFATRLCEITCQLRQLFIGH